MSKNIIFCADGTWNGPGDPSDGEVAITNVYKTFANLAGTLTPGLSRDASEQECVEVDQAGRVVQIAKYLHGVGNSDNYLVKFLGGTVGDGLIGRIVRGYTFISRNYVPGDQITIIGFSRGAYTARALAGLIAAKGLLDANRHDLANDRQRAYKMGLAVWYEHRGRADRQGGWIGQLQAAKAAVLRFLTFTRPGKLVAPVPIRAVGVWDTVGAMGIPVFTDHDTVLDLFRFADTRLSPAVEAGFHAVALDEQRANFTPTYWDADSRVTQVAFPGAHADVGGGNDNRESGLSDLACRWMQARLTSVGVHFADQPVAPIAPDALAIAHRPWTEPLWLAFPNGPREIPAEISVSQAVLERKAAQAVPVQGHPDPIPYRPGNLHIFDQMGNLKPDVKIEPHS